MLLGGGSCTFTKVLGALLVGDQLETTSSYPLTQAALAVSDTNTNLCIFTYGNFHVIYYDQES